MDSKALLATYITRLPLLLLAALAGAILGGGIYLLAAAAKAGNANYVSETRYYINFADGHYEDYYNAYTWNSVIADDPILGRAMEALGDGYDRNAVRGMITAQMPSDVRYLTVFVKGKVPEEVTVVKNALESAFVEFGKEMKEFDSIYKINDAAIVKEKTQYFSWRAAFLGAVIFFGVGVFGIAVSACIGSVFYTKNDIMKVLGIPACGMTFAGDVPIKRQLEMLESNLWKMTREYIRIVLIDADGGVYAKAFMEYIKECGLTHLTEFMTVVDVDCYDELGKGTAVIAVIPFGRHYREKITDEINCVASHGGKVVSAVLVNVNRVWMSIYYSHKLSSE